MKKVMLTLITLLFNVILLQAQITTNGLIAHWNFNGNVKDVSGHGHDGTATNLTTTVGQSGNPNTAYYFDGTSSHVDVLGSSDFNVGTYSICAILRPRGFYTGLCQGNRILMRGKENDPGSYFLQYTDNPYDSSCNINGDTSNFVFNANINGKATWESNWQYTPTVRTGQWYCVVGTFDGAVFKIYVNGTLKTTVVPKQNFNVGTSTDGLSIGYSYLHTAPGLYPYWLNADVDDICLYNRALTSTEIGNYCGAAYQQGVNLVYILQPHKANVCKGDTIHLNYAITGTFNAGNTFTAQLSDASGSFASPTNVGSVTSSTAGMIVCTIPAGAATGTGYRIRIVSSAPGMTSADNGIDIGVASPATVSTSVTPSDTICAGITATFTANLTNANSGAVLQWKINGSSVPGANGMVFTSNTLSNNDYVTVDVLNANSCTPYLSSGVTMAVVPKTTPSASLTVDPDTNVWPGLQVTFKAVYASAGQNPKFQWQVNLSNVKGATDSVWSTTDLKDGDVVGYALTSDNPCSTIKYVASKRVTMHLPASVNDVYGTTRFTLYPNPNKGSFSLKGKTNSTNEINIEVLNSIGQVVYKNSLYPAGGEFSKEIELNNAGNGVYLLRYCQNGETSTRTFTVNQ